MPPLMTRLARRFGLPAVLLLLAAGASAQPVTPAPAAPAGTARIWFYRDWEPYESLNLANVELNGAYAGSVQNGGALYRDVPPGHYHIAAESFGKDFNQTKDVDLAPGQVIFCKILSLSSWESGGDRHSFKRDTFYVWLMPPQVAQAEIARDRSGI